MNSRLRMTSSVTGWLPLVVMLAGPAATWFAVWHNGWDTPWKLTAIGLAVPLSIAVAAELRRELERRREIAERTPLPERLSPEQLEQWRMAVRSAVAQLRLSAGQQLDTIVRHSEPVNPVARVDGHDMQVRVDGQLVAWAELIRRWDAQPRHRLVIVGKPGYGKTVAALRLVKHINTQDSTTPGAPVAELFGLADWQRWRAEHPDAPLAQWLVEQLTLTHPNLAMPIEVARQLLDDELVLPILDGLDEIADIKHRRACADAIDAYAGRGAPHRPFVLTCRTTDYEQLAPDLVGDDERVELIGMQPDQIRQRLKKQAARQPAWTELRQHQAAGEHAINALFESPLYLAIALQVYRDDDPSQLLTLSVEQAQQHLWELLLNTHADSYRNATAAQIRGWLAWLAAGMRDSGRQRFMLHELYQLDPNHATTFRRYQIAIGLIIGLVFGLAGGLAVGLVAGLVGGLGGLTVSPAASVRTRLGWRDRLRSATRTEALVTDLGVGLVGGLVGREVGLDS